MRFDIHIHTSFSSCSSLAPSEVIAKAAAAGLDGVCITDHNSMDIRQSLREGVQDNGLVVIFGMEYDTPGGDFLIFGPFEDIPAGFDARELLRYVHNAGGIAIGAHPERRSRPLDSRLLEKGLLRHIEIFNGRNSTNENREAVKAARRNNLFGLAGSDAHTIEEVGDIFTDFSVPVYTRNDFILALKQGYFSLPSRFWSEIHSDMVFSA